MENKGLNPMRNPSSNVKGFTLIELMIVVAIIAILAAIALPAYRDYITRGNLVNATNQLSAWRAQMEQYYQDARQYTDVTGPPAFTSPCGNVPTSNNWTFSCAPLPASYLLKAVGSGPVAGFTYTIDQSNNQVSLVVPSAWGSSGTAHWIMRKGG